jgi:hypothetical protein
MNNKDLSDHYAMSTILKEYEEKFPAPVKTEKVEEPPVEAPIDVAPEAPADVAPKVEEKVEAPADVAPKEEAIVETP